MSTTARVKDDFVIPDAVLEVLTTAVPEGIKVMSAQSWGLSSECKTAKLSAMRPDGTRVEYFLKIGLGDSGRTGLWGAHFNSSAIASHVPGLTPAPIAKGKFTDVGGEEAYFLVQEYFDLDQSSPPDPSALAMAIAELHTKAVSPNGMFGYPIVTGRGTTDRKEHWSPSWADQFTYLLMDLIKMDNQVNGAWPQYDAACKQLLNEVIPRVLGALQSNGRQIVPVLCHGDLWEGNVATDIKTGNIVIFDNDECMYAHNEMEFATWRCRWASHFRSPVYIQHYQLEIEPAEPAREWDDRNRLYSIKTALCDSAGQGGSSSRQLAYNDMLFLCEKYAPHPSLEAYDPREDITVTSDIEPYEKFAGAEYPIQQIIRT